MNHLQGASGLCRALQVNLERSKQEDGLKRHTVAVGLLWGPFVSSGASFGALAVPLASRWEVFGACLKHGVLFGGGKEANIVFSRSIFNVQRLNLR